MSTFGYLWLAMAALTYFWANIRIARMGGDAKSDRVLALAAVALLWAIAFFLAS